MGALDLETEGLGVILDCDGVLLDSISSWYEAEDRLAQANGVTLTEAQKAHINTFTLPQAGEWFHAELGMGASAQDVVDSINDYLMDYYSTRAAALPGALEFVRALAEAGVPRAVVSSSPLRFLHAGLSQTGFSEYLPLVFSADDLHLTKSEPEIFQRALDAMGAQRGRTWGADDSRFALKTLSDMGIHTIGIYSSDECATREELPRIAEHAYGSLGELGFDGLAELVRRETSASGC